MAFSIDLREFFYHNLSFLETQMNIYRSDDIGSLFVIQMVFGLIWIVQIFLICVLLVPLLYLISIYQVQMYYCKILKVLNLSTFRSVTIKKKVNGRKEIVQYHRWKQMVSQKTFLIFNISHYCSCVASWIL